jgi:DNA polymerase III alpha subunit
MFKNGRRLITGGIINCFRQIVTKNKELMYFANLEDNEEMTEIVIFPKIAKENKELLREDMPVIVWGKIDNREGKDSLICDKIVLLSEKNIEEIVRGILREGV